MRTAEITTDRRLAVTVRQEPVPGPGEVVVQVRYCGICGSDLHMRTDAAVPAGAVLGHEVVGAVRATGPDVSDWGVGDRVAVLPYRNCGTCPSCRRGEENHCVSGGHLGSVVGVQRPGGLADFVLVDAGQLYRLPHDLPDELAALSEPVAVAVRAAGNVTCGPGDPVQVLGAGPIGVLVACVLRARGMTDVTVVELNEGRRQAADRLGLTTATPEAARGRGHASGGPAVVVDATGSAAALAAAVDRLATRGRLVCVGLPSAPPALDVEQLVLRELAISGAAGYSRADFAAAIELLAREALPLASFISAVTQLADVDAAFDALAFAGTHQLKILVRP